MIYDIDWHKAWIEYNHQRPAPGSQDFWDGRAEFFEKKVGVSEYAKRFLELLAPEPGASIMDVGCGSGALAIPLAEAGHPVLAVDFSLRMLESLEAHRAAKGLDKLRSQQLDFNEDWQAAGIEPKSVDIAIASRSTMVDDLQEAFQKLNTVARHRVAITMGTAYGPRTPKPSDSHEPKGPPDFIFGLNLLLQMGFYPRLSFIDTSRHDRLVRWAYLSWDVVRELD